MGNTIFILVIEIIKETDEIERFGLLEVRGNAENRCGLSTAAECRVLLALWTTSAEVATAYF